MKDRKSRRYPLILTALVAVTTTATAVYYRKQFHQTDDMLARWQETDLGSLGVPDEMKSKILRGEMLLFKFNDGDEEFMYVPLQK